MHHYQRNAATDTSFVDICIWKEFNHLYLHLEKNLIMCNFIWEIVSGYIWTIYTGCFGELRVAENERIHFLRMKEYKRKYE